MGECCLGADVMLSTICLAGHSVAVAVPANLIASGAPVLQSRFGEVLDLLVARHLHRMFICDADMRPAGVVSCTDILRLIAGPAD